MQKAYSDVTQNNIASLPFDLVDLVIKAKPKVFICENVPAFASRAEEVFERVLRALRFPEDRAYYANWQVLTASDFGVPQKRQRLFIIGVRKDVGDLIGTAGACITAVIESFGAQRRQIFRVVPNPA